MAQSLSATSAVLGLLIFTSVISMVNACEVAVVGGGCPDEIQCLDTCRPCFRGIGKLRTYCASAGAGFPYPRCICSLEAGAPCPPPGPPRCPKPWPPTATIATNHNQTH